MTTETARKSGYGWALLLVLVFSPVKSLSYEEIAVANGGAVKGTVKFQGQVPKLPPLQVTKAKDFCGSVPNESLAVGRENGLRYAVVTLEGVSKGVAVEREIVHELDNIKCRFVPHVQVASVGQWLVLKNTDPILHTAHALFTGQPQFNVGLYPGKVSRKPLVSTGVTKIVCEIHPWMSAYVVVTEHPYHAVTDLYGEYDIRDIPPGNYRVRVWHESLGTQEKQVEIRSGAVSTADFLLSLPRGGKK
ncbi:MAG TPA: carboxypeptidase regulatory-like domain-containing protein [Candidatus Acidoferrales bacterium]|nr:carboxypeptidase regulatory-like domain-containing protein [Candidatus Acidoferrales bacterium]